ncbi:hypothetical protein KL933_000430 [Ogataea haglerorum]|uniref:Uncharacterized protein n=1 Tax=Ogataea haglerorum TaxID=1937702 RepID=A0AAN6DAR4_9ASCO|nr:uncharacterized protein KL911_003591 [Ogataea haglerorum]KAG7701879.1 hypothetical protein KL951_000335 [Ogataea haglerorum]KAG7730635.1 hypothetical protein KL933_000430 [Ogataea haglerorum]KAG7734768.1 hypothetical protein KL948_000334 [Ogataea haglerorum]KAG7751145.1 hypothetical protein KL912_000278 [Ogataea haglerorum]KAG7752860.1 hypothetical protein KL911_003591 [Ogataea haglerorum]
MFVRASSFARPSAARSLLNFARNTSSTASKSKKPVPRPGIDRIGVPFDPYVPMRMSRLPSPLTAPRVYLKSIWNRLLLFAYNQVQVYYFKKSMGKKYKPNFLKWKNEAIETFVRVNKGFAEKKLASIRTNVSQYVYDALEARTNRMPASTTMGWELVKFNSVPKIISVHSFPHEDGVPLLLQIVYRFDTRQQLVVKKAGQDAQNNVRDLTEYLAFNIDPFTDRIVLAGSVFESPVSRGVAPKEGGGREEILAQMKAHGDIYRIEQSQE